MGITALRNAGDALQQEEEEAMAEMSSDPSFPKVLTAGRALARGEGYGGFLGHSLRPNADLGQTVAEEIGRGADFIKVIVSGAVDFSRSAVEGPYFSESQLKEVVAVASSFGVPVAAHANGPKSIGAAVRAGVSTLEHGILMDDRGMEEMCAHGTAWVPTLTPLFNLSKSGRYPALQGLLVPVQQPLQGWITTALAQIEQRGQCGDPGGPVGAHLLHTPVIDQYPVFKGGHTRPHSGTNGLWSIGMRSHRNSKRRGNRHHFLELRFREIGAFHSTPGKIHCAADYHFDEVRSASDLFRNRLPQISIRPEGMTQEPAISLAPGQCAAGGQDFGKGGI